MLARIWSASVSAALIETHTNVLRRSSGMFTLTVKERGPW